MFNQDNNQKTYTIREISESFPVAYFSVYRQIQRAEKKHQYIITIKRAGEFLICREKNNRIVLVKTSISEKEIKDKVSEVLTAILPYVCKSCRPTIERIIKNATH